MGLVTVLLTRETSVALSGRERMSALGVTRLNALKAKYGIVPKLIKATATERTITLSRVIPETVNLSNPNDIMPQDYDLALVRNDINIIATAIEKVGRKYPKYVCTGGIDWKGQGTVSQIVSSATAPLRCPTWPIQGQVSLTEGEYDEFWTTDIISDREAYMGVVYLYGEIDFDVLTVRDCAAYRSRKAACR